MIEKIEVGKEYIDGEGLKIKVTAVGEQNILYTFSRTEYSEAISFAKMGLSELPKPKPKVKRARYLYKSVIDDTLPVCTNTYYKDVNDFLKGRCSKKDAYIFIKKLNETEREFDE